MGHTNSKNVTSAIAEVGTQLSDNVVVTDYTNSLIDNMFNLEQCFISGSVNFKNVGLIIGSNRQIVNAVQSVSISNQLAQIINKNAMAIVKPLKLGHKKSMQVTSRFASQAVNISNVITDIASAGAYTSNDWDCERSFIIGDVNVGYNTIDEFWQNQVGNYQQTEVIANKILQGINQNTTTKISGISTSVVLAVIIIIISTLVISYPSASFISGYRPYLISCICLSILALPIVLYLSKVYPFYFKNSSCSIYSDIKGKICEECISVMPETFQMDNAPLRYLNNIFYDPEDKDLPFGLLNMAASSLCTDSVVCSYNNGYNAQTWFNCGQNTDRRLWSEDKNPPEGLYPLPNPLMVPTDCNDMYCKIPLQFNNITTDQSTDSLTPQVYSPELKKGPIPFNTNNSQSTVNLSNRDQKYVTDRLNTMAVLNVEGWREYIQKHGERGALHARFILTHFLKYDTSIYVNDDEEVGFSDGSTGIAKDNKDKTFRFSDFNKPLSWDKRIDSGGNVTGPLGICVDREYKVGHAFTTYINWIIIIIIIIVVIALVYFHI